MAKITITLTDVTVAPVGGGQATMRVQLTSDPEPTDPNPMNWTLAQYLGRWGVDQIIGALEKHFAGHKIADPETKH